MRYLLQSHGIILNTKISRLSCYVLYMFSTGDMEATTRKLEGMEMWFHHRILRLLWRDPTQQASNFWRGPEKIVWKAKNTILRTHNEEWKQISFIAEYSARKSNLKSFSPLFRDHKYHACHSLVTYWQPLRPIDCIQAEKIDSVCTFALSFPGRFRLTILSFYFIGISWLNSCCRQRVVFYIAWELTAWYFLFPIELCLCCIVLYRAL